MKSFQQRCYEKLKQVPKGKVTTYLDLARALGTNAARAVGTAMKKNDKLIVVPCHRVVRSNGEVGFYNGGEDIKVDLLRSEGIEIVDGKVDLKKYLHVFR